ncbi:MAG: 4Fe-4S dicluster domain-containing protein [Candidatus Hermodarchaeota archaeon]
MTRKSSIEIKINEEKCTGCIICNLWCSYTHYKIFDPSKSNIKIENSHSLNPKIIFLDSCTNCGQCANHCLYGALLIEEGIK